MKTTSHSQSFALPGSFALRGRFTLPQRSLAVRRSAVLISIVVHLALLAALSALRSDGESNAALAPGTLQVVVFPLTVESEDTAAAEAGGDSTAVDAEAASELEAAVTDRDAAPTPEPDTTPTPEPGTPDAELTAAESVPVEAMPPDSEEPAPAESQVMEPEPAPPPAEAVADSAEAETDTAETEPADAPEQQAAVSSDPSTPRAVPEPDQVPETEAGAEPVVTIADRTDADEITEVPERPVFPSELTPDEATEVPLETEPIEESESRRLTRRVERWATRFAALAEWQPETTWTARGQEYSATVSRIPATDSMGVEEAIVTITTERDGEQFATRMRMKRLGFSHFVQFVDRWDPKVFIHDDVIDGRFHSNSEINISREGGAQPTFTGKVTTRGIDSSGSPQAVRRSEVFLGGLDIRAARINLPRRLSLFADEDIAPERLHRFNVDTHIIFHSDGSYSWTEIRSRRDADAASTIADAGDRHRMLTDEPHYIVAADDVELHISGTLDGKVLIYSPKRIVVEGDLVYAEHPASFPDSDDYLGLVSERDVAIAEPEVTGPGDLHLHAAIYARNRFAVRNFRHSADGTLFVYGSITAGSLTATEPRFSTQINFDKRLEQTRPPRFPVTDRYEISEWDAEWTAVPASTVP